MLARLGQHIGSPRAKVSNLPTYLPVAVSITARLLKQTLSRL